VLNGVHAKNRRHRVGDAITGYCDSLSVCLTRPYLPKPLETIKCHLIYMVPGDICGTN